VPSVGGVTGENVGYTCDSLNRLIAASTSGTGGVQWGNSYSYDGFGNLTGKTVTKGTAPTLSPLVDSTTNRVRLSGDYGYDANGNWMGTPSAPNYWSMENRLLANGSVDGSGNLLLYAYDPWGRRVLQYAASANWGPTGTLHFYSITGQRLATYSTGYPTQTSQLSVSMYFGARPLKAVDRLGSVRNNGNAIAYYPWGEERTSTADGTDKFATYFRDGFGEDYANARYYNSNLGRFWSPDPMGPGAAKKARPNSWNQYVYAADDPVNRGDPSGLCDAVMGGITQNASNAPAVMEYGYADVVVFPYSSYGTGALGLLTGVLAVAAQTFGPNSATFASVEGLVLAFDQGGPINVTTFSGGAASFTAAVAFLNSHGGQNIVSMIGNITYVSPGAAGTLYNNGSAIVLEGTGPQDDLAMVATTTGNIPIGQAAECGHDFGCIVNHFASTLWDRKGPDCSSPLVVNDSSNSSEWSNLLPSGPYGCTGANCYSVSDVMSWGYSPMTWVTSSITYFRGDYED
jgi:RHS repeat-associated protein